MAYLARSSALDCRSLLRATASTGLFAAAAETRELIERFVPHLPAFD